MEDIHPSTCAALFWPVRERNHVTSSIYCEKCHPSPCLGPAGESTQAESKGKKDMREFQRNKRRLYVHCLGCLVVVARKDGEGYCNCGLYYPHITIM